MRDWSDEYYWPLLKALYLEEDEDAQEQALRHFAKRAITPDSSVQRTPEIGIRELWHAPQLETLPESVVDILLSVFSSVNPDIWFISIANILGWLPQPEVAQKIKNTLNNLPEDTLPDAVLGLQFALGNHNDPTGKEAARDYVIQRITHRDIGQNYESAWKLFRMAIMVLRKHATDIDAKLLRKAAKTFDSPAAKLYFRLAECAKSVQFSDHERMLELLKAFHVTDWWLGRRFWIDGEFISEYYWEPGWNLALASQRENLELAAPTLARFSTTESKIISESLLGPWKYDLLSREGDVNVEKALLAPFTHRYLFREPLW